jgi:signal transduction histidine kinase
MNNKLRPAVERDAANDGAPSIDSPGTQHACLTFDAAGTLTSWNQAAEPLVRHCGAHAAGLHVSAMTAPYGGPGAIRAGDLDQAQQRGCISRLRRLEDGDGQDRYEQVSIFSLRNSAGFAGYTVLVQPRLIPAATGVGAPVADSGSASRELAESKVLLAAEIADRKQAEALRMRLLRRLVVAQEEERRRIARDLHDDIGQRLTALRLTLEAFAARLEAGTEQATTMARVLHGIARLDQDLDFIAWELRPAALDQFGLVRVLETYVAEWSRHTQIPAAFHAIPGDVQRFLPEVEASVYRIAQEALNNVAKHAAAQSVSVLLELRGDSLALVVEDDGVGCEPINQDETMIGLMGMRERARAVGGTLELEPTPGGGTTVLARIPIHATYPDVVAPSDDSGDAADRVPTTDGADELADKPAASLRTIRLRLQELHRAVGARDEFIATVAHELRNPIAPLTFQLRLAINKTEHMAATGQAVPIDWIQSQLRGVEQRLHRLLETLDRLLDVSRLSTGRIDLELEPVNLAAVVRDVLSTLDAELAVARCQVSLVEEGETDGVWDRLRVEQICRNLLSNAIRFGAGRPIDVSVAGDREFARLQVSDHGIGIAADQQARIFERFERGVQQRSGGFGVGLWIVRNICVAMGGTVTVQSQLGEGACFTVMLPRGAALESLRTQSESH